MKLLDKNKQITERELMRERREERASMLDNNGRNIEKKNSN